MLHAGCTTTFSKPFSLVNWYHYCSSLYIHSIALPPTYAPRYRHVRRRPNRWSHVQSSLSKVFFGRCWECGVGIIILSSPTNHPVWYVWWRTQVLFLDSTNLIFVHRWKVCSLKPGRCKLIWFTRRSRMSNTPECVWFWFWETLKYWVAGLWRGRNSSSRLRIMWTKVTTYKLGLLTNRRGSASGSSPGSSESFLDTDWRVVTIFAVEGARARLSRRLLSHFSTSDHCAWGVVLTWRASVSREPL